MFAFVTFQDPGISAWMVLNAALSVARDITACFPLFYDGPEEEGRTAAKPLLVRMAQIAIEYPDMLCPTVPELCGLESLGPSRTNQILAKWWMDGTPYLQKHTFISWSRSMGAKSMYMYWANGFLEEVTPQMVDRIVECFRDRESFADDDQSRTAFIQMQVEQVGGAISDVPKAHSSYGHRSAKLLWSIQSFAPHRPREPLEHAMNQWTSDTFHKLEPFFTGSYPNYAFDYLDGWSYKYYGEENYKKLQALKEEFGGYDLFSTHQRIQPD